jgi:hypothetical protein
MRATFKITANHELVSAVRSKGEPHTLTVGMRVWLVSPYETEHGTIPAGCKGFVEHVDEYDGTTWVLMEGMEPALFHWDNRLVLSPYTCEDLVACIRLPVDKRVPVSHQLTYRSAALC